MRIVMSDSRITIQRVSRLVRIHKRDECLIVPIKYQFEYLSHPVEKVERLFFIKKNPSDSTPIYLRKNQEVDDTLCAIEEWNKQKEAVLHGYKKSLINELTAYSGLQESDINIEIANIGKCKTSPFARMGYRKNKSENSDGANYAIRNKDTQPATLPSQQSNLNEFNEADQLVNQEYELAMECNEVTFDENEYNQYVTDEKEWINSLVTANENDREFIQYIKRQHQEFNRYIEEEKKEKEWIDEMVVDNQRNEQQELEVQRVQNYLQETEAYTQTAINYYMGIYCNDHQEEDVTLQKFAQFFNLDSIYVEQILAELNKEMNQVNNNELSIMANQHQEVESLNKTQIMREHSFLSNNNQVTKEILSRPNSIVIKKY